MKYDFSHQKQNEDFGTTNLKYKTKNWSYQKKIVYYCNNTSKFKNEKTKSEKEYFTLSIRLHMEYLDLAKAPCDFSFE